MKAILIIVASLFISRSIYRSFFAEAVNEGMAEAFREMDYHFNSK